VVAVIDKSALGNGVGKVMSPVIELLDTTPHCIIKPLGKYVYPLAVVAEEVPKVNVLDECLIEAEFTENDPDTALIDVELTEYTVPILYEVAFTTVELAVKSEPIVKLEAFADVALTEVALILTVPPKVIPDNPVRFDTDKVDISDPLVSFIII